MDEESEAICVETLRLGGMVQSAVFPMPRVVALAAVVVWDVVVCGLGVLFLVPVV